MRAIILCLLLLAGGNQSLRAALSKADTDLITQTSERAAYVESLTEFCDTQNPGKQTANRQALDDWRKRNHWDVLGERLAAQPQFNPAFAQLKARYSGNLNGNVQKTGQLCGYFSQLLRYPDFDPSAKRAADLERIASLLTMGRPQAPPSPEPPPQVSQSAPPPPPAVAPGQEFSAAGAVFTVPPGWRVSQVSPEGALLERTAKYGGKSIIYIGTKAAAGDIQESLRAALLDQFPALKLKNMRAGVASTGVPGAYVKEYGPLKSGGRSAQVAAVGLLVNGRLLLAQLVSTASAGDYFDHGKDFEKMVATWRLPNVSGAVAYSPLTPPSGSGGMNAVYLGSQIRNELNPLGGMDLKAIRTYLVLLRNGQAYRDLPPDGHVLDMDFAAALQAHPKDCGTYRIEGDKIIFRWIDDYGLVLEQTAAFHKQSAAKSFIDLGNVNVIQVSPANNLQISGRYTSTFYMSGSTAMSSTGITSQTFIAFNPDGTYQKSGFGSASFSNTGASGTVSSQRGLQNGHYAINGFTLTLTPANGQSPELYTIIFEEISPSPKAIFINDKAFLR